MGENIYDHIPPWEIEKPNPWAVKAAEALEKTARAKLGLEDPSEESQPNPVPLEELQKVYGPTLEAIELGYSTPEHISRYTGRDKKTESSYLWRLKKAGYIKLDERDGFERQF